MNAASYLDDDAWDDRQDDIGDELADTPRSDDVAISPVVAA